MSNTDVVDEHSPIEIGLPEPIETLYTPPFDNEWPLVIHIVSGGTTREVRATLPAVPPELKLSELKDHILALAVSDGIGPEVNYLPDHIYLEVDGAPIEFAYPTYIPRSPLPVYIDHRFVSSEGGTRNITPAITRTDVLLSDLFPAGPPTELHVYPLATLVDIARRFRSTATVKRDTGAIGSAVAAMDRQLLHGYLKVFFPGLKRDPFNERTEAAGAEKDASDAKTRASAASRQIEQLEEIESRLHERDFAMAAVRGYRRFGMQAKGAFHIDSEEAMLSLFYRLPTSGDLPFIRFVPQNKAATPVMKLYTLPGLRVRVPFVRDPRVIRQWSGERKPIDPSTGKATSYITFKIEVARMPTVVYATGYIFPNGTVTLICTTDSLTTSDNLMAVGDVLHVRDVFDGFVTANGVSSAADNIRFQNISANLRWSPGEDNTVMSTSATISDELAAFDVFFRRPPPSSMRALAPTGVTGTMKHLVDFEWTRVSQSVSQSATSGVMFVPSENNNDEDDEYDVGTGGTAGAGAGADEVGAEMQSIGLGGMARISVFASATEITVLIDNLPTQDQLSLIQTLVSMMITSSEQRAAEGKSGRAATIDTLAVKKYHITQLKAADVNLFVYQDKNSANNQYSRKCGAPVKRQPNVLTPELFRRHKEEYKDDVAFWVYDMETYKPGVPPTTIGGKEVIHFVKTTTFKGTPKERESHMHYYFCPVYWCVLDNMMVLKRDFVGTAWRGKAVRKGPKPKNTCPFCGGKEVSGANIILHGEDRQTILVRGTEQKAPRYPVIIGEHPDDPSYRLPCCNARIADIGGKLFSKPKPFAKLFKKFTDVNILSSEKQNPKPLAPGKLGMLREWLRDYFHPGVSETRLFSAPAQSHRTVLSKHYAVLRVGLDNSPVARSYSFLNLLGFYKGDSLVAGGEPLAVDVLVEHMLAFVTPRIFEQLQYGRMVHEFYSETADVPVDTVLTAWVKQYQLPAITETTRVYLQRLYIAYTNFVKYTRVGVTEDPDSPDGAVKFKDWKVYAHIARMPGFLHPRGIQLILLEQISRRGRQEYRVMCPPGGVSPVDPASDAPVAVAVLTPKYLAWEPLMICDRTTDALRVVRFWNVGTPEFVARYPTVNTAAAGMLVEYRAAGRCGPSVTASLGENELTLSELLSLSPTTPAGVVRDTYNQLRGAIWPVGKVAATSATVITSGSSHKVSTSIVGPVSTKVVAKKSALAVPAPVAMPVLSTHRPSGGYVFVPCVDDGTVHNLPVVYEMRGFDAASASDVLKFYTGNSTWLGVVRAPIERVALSERAVASDQGRRPAEGASLWVVGVRLTNGDVVPVAMEPTTPEEVARTADKPMPMRTVVFLPDTIDKLLYTIDNPHWQRPGHIYDSPEVILRRRQLVYEEVYQHIRVALSTRLQEDTPFRLKVEGILGNAPHQAQLTVPQKQREMLVLVLAAVRDIVVPVALRKELKPRGEGESGYEESARLRRNCYAISENDKCDASTQCAWISPSATSKGVCRVRMMGHIEGISEDPDLHMAKRISDELVRYPAKREEILQNRVPRMPIIREPTLSETGELVYPELSTDFAEFTAQYWKQPSMYRNNFRFYGDEGLLRDTEAAEDKTGLEGLLNGEEPEEGEGEGKPEFDLSGMMNNDDDEGGEED